MLRKLRKTIWHLLEGDSRTTRLGRVVNTLLAALIVANVAGVMLETVRSVALEYHVFLRYFEIGSVLVFTVEYLVRVWAAVENPELGETPLRRRWNYAKSPMALIDLMAIAPFYLGPFVSLDTRVLRAFRLLRIFKLARHSASMDLLLTVLRREAGAFVSIVTVILVVVVLAATGIYFLERDTGEPNFGSIPAAMWWAAITLTTVGYGDVVPQTMFGRVFGVAITFAGVGLVALPAGLLASSFSEELGKRRTEYRRHLAEVLEDGEMTDQEAQALDATRINLGLTVHDAALLQDGGGLSSCPHCGKPLHEGSASES